MASVIGRDEIEIDEEREILGAGSFGTVQVGRCRGFVVAVKSFESNLNEEQLYWLREEVEIMR